MEALLVLILLGGFLCALSLSACVGSQLSRQRQFSWEPIPGSPIPYRRRNFLFSTAERSFYKALRDFVPDHMIFVKVRLADLVSVRPSGQSFWEYFAPINRKHIDFVVCDTTLAPVLAIELDELPEGSPVQDDLVNSVLKSASLPVVHLPGKRRYLGSELRGLLAPYLSVAAPMI